MTFNLGEPVYKGRSLINWLYQYSVNFAGTTTDAQKVRDEAAVAVRVMGTNALPTLLKMAKAQDSKLKTRMTALSRRQSVVNVHLYTEEENHIMAFRGFQILGNDASPVVHSLTVLLADKDNDIRATVACDLGSIGPSARAAVPTLLTLLEDKDDIVRTYAVMALADIHEEPDITIPALVNCLRSSKWLPSNRRVIVRSILNALGMYNNKANQAVYAIVPLLNDNDVLIREDATNAVLIIAPEILKK